MRTSGIGANSLGQAEVRNVRLIVGIQQNVRRLHIPVHDAVAMGIVQGSRDEHDITGRLTGGQGALDQALRKTRSFHEIHAVERLAANLADFVDGHNVGMAKLSIGFRFQPKARQIIGIRAWPRQDHLDRDNAIQADLPRLEHHAHAASADFLEQRVIAKVFSRLNPNAGRGVLGGLVIRQSRWLGRLRTSRLGCSSSQRRKVMDVFLSWDCARHR